MSFILMRAVPVGWCCLLLVQQVGCARADSAATGVVGAPPNLVDSGQQQEPMLVVDAGIDLTPPATGTPEAGVSTARLRPWGDESLQISVWGKVRDGLSRFEAERRELTPAQLEALNGLRGVPTPPGPPEIHLASYEIRITERSGAYVTYRAADYNLLGGDELNPTLPSIDVQTLDPFLAASHCLPVSETLDRLLYDLPEVTPDAGAAQWLQAPAISSETPGCFHAIALPMQCMDVPLRLDVETAGTYRLSLVDCFQPLAMTVFSPDGSVELGAASGGVNDCAVLVQSFAEPGSYPLVIRKYSNCEGTGVDGSVFLRVRR